MNRAIDVPLESLPRIDEYSVQIDAEPQVTWSALLPVIARSFGGSVSGRIARALGCEHTEAHGDPEETGATVPGFVVARAIVPTLYALLGAHRFARYALVFCIESIDDGDRSLLRAETRAEFPGTKGRIYRALVIGTRGHVLVVRRLLSAVGRRAERA